jgi:membrane protein
MSLKNRKVEGWAKRAETMREERSAWGRTRYYFYLLLREVVNDDLVVRSESLSYLTLFSILPIIAGCFLVLGFLSAWGPFQNEFEGFLIRFFEPIPADYRDVLLDFIFEFKEEYLSRLRSSSGWLAVISFGTLFWITAKSFFNLENTINQIWEVPVLRSWRQRLTNFTVAAFLLPVFAGVAFVLPTIISRWGKHAEQAGAGLEQMLPFLVFFLLSMLMYRGLPNQSVSWRSAAAGAAGSALLFFISHQALRIYFKFGTQSAYGKLAALPLVAFFIFVFWLIVLLGVEISFLHQQRQNEKNK